MLTISFASVVLSPIMIVEGAQCDIWKWSTVQLKWQFNLFFVDLYKFILLLIYCFILEFGEGTLSVVEEKRNGASCFRKLLKVLGLKWGFGWSWETLRSCPFGKHSCKLVGTLTLSYLWGLEMKGEKILSYYSLMPRNVERFTDYTFICFLCLK